MQVSGFNHASSPSDFSKFFYGNDKPLIYHFDDGKTLVMNKQSDGYVAVADGKMYTLNAEGFSESEIGGGGSLPVITLSTVLTIDNIEAGLFVNDVDKIVQAYPCFVANHPDDTKLFKSIASIGDSNSIPIVSFQIPAYIGSYTILVAFLSNTPDTSYGDIISIEG